MKHLFCLLIVLFLIQGFSCESTGQNEKKDAAVSDKRQTKTKPDTTINNKMDSTTGTNKFKDLNKDAFALHYDAIVIDTHNDVLMPVMLEGADLTKENSSTQSDLVKWRKGGLDVQVFSIYVPERYKTGHFKYVNKLIDHLEQTAKDYPEMLYLTDNYNDLMKGLNDKHFCGLMGAEGGAMIEGSIDKLETLYKRGVRYLGLTWNTSNEIGVSGRDETERGRKGGLTEFGKDVVRKMNELGMLVDVSHIGETAFWDVVETSNAPIIASHSCVYNLCPHYRNLTDDQIKAIAKSGGYIGVNFYCNFINPNSNISQVRAIHNKYKSAIGKIEDQYGDDLIEFNEARYAYLEENKTNSGTPIDMLIDHIDYIVKLVGIDYVGLGSDFDGGVDTPNELYDATCYPVITKKLVERGYSEQDIRKILGLNFLRVFKQVCNK
jgi:membrane dipeptidase